MIAMVKTGMDQMVLRLMPDWLPMDQIGKKSAREHHHADHTLLNLSAPATEGDDALVRAQQIAAMLRNAPIAGITSFINACIVLVAAWGETNKTVLVGWFGSAMFVVVWVLWSWLRNRRRAVRRASIRGISKSIQSAFISAMPWAVLLPLLYPDASPDLRVIITAITAGMTCGGAISLSRVLPASQIYLITISSGGIIAFLAVGGQAQFILAAALCLYTCTLYAMIRTLYDLSVQNARSFIAIERQNQMINFLLKDFEESVSDWLWETNAAGEIIYHSDRMCAVTGLERNMIRGKPLAYWAADGGNDEAWRKWDDVVRAQRPYRNMLLPTKVRGESRFWQMTARPLYDDDGQFLGYRGVAGDVTLAQAADSMRLAKEEAEQANAAKSRFLAVMSHELRTPLNSIIGFAELIARELHGPTGKPEYVDYAKIIMDSSHHLLSIINDVLDMARSEHRAEAINETEFPLSDLIEGSLSFVSHTASDAKLKLSVDKLDDTLCIRGDARMLRQLLLNLLANAIKFTPQGGEVRVSAIRDDDGDVRITVTDTGHGVPADKLGRIFEPFVQADDGISRKAGGVGLGLSIASNIAKLHDARLLFESEEQKGSTATLVLPSSRVLESRAFELKIAARA